MQARIETLKEKKILGRKINMSFSANKTMELWSGFAPRIKEIKSRPNEEKISLQLYPPQFYTKFNPQTEFEKWAAVEVTNFEDVPDNMECFVIEEGLYAVFDYKGASNNNQIFQTIFTNWLPNSAYELDNRPHFEILGEKYKNNSPDSEEEIWIPIRKK